MPIISKFIALNKYIPSGIPSISDFSLKEEKIELNNNNQVIVANEWISVDPYMRARMTERKNYKPPFQINKPMEGAAIGKVIESNSSKFSKDDVVISDYGWRDNYIANDNEINKIIPADVPLQTYLGPLGMTGHTAYVGLFKIGKLKKNHAKFPFHFFRSVTGVMTEIETRPLVIISLPRNRKISHELLYSSRIGLLFLGLFKHIFVISF